jgi:hypothetical protein
VFPRNLKLLPFFVLRPQSEHNLSFLFALLFGDYDLRCPLGKEKCAGCKETISLCRGMLKVSMVVGFARVGRL